MKDLLEILKEPFIQVGLAFAIGYPLIFIVPLLIHKSKFRDKEDKYEAEHEWKDEENKTKKDRRGC